MVDSWKFSLGNTLKGCLSENSSLVDAMDLRLPQSQLADKLISSVRQELRQATDNAVLNIESRFDGVTEPSSDLQRSLRDLVRLNLAGWNMPQYPSTDEFRRVNSEATNSQLSYLVSREIGSDSSLLEKIKTFNINCQGHLFSEQLPKLLSNAASVKLRVRVIGELAQNLTERVDSIVNKVVGSSRNFKQILNEASDDLANYLEVAARKKLKDFETILAKDEAGHCEAAAQKFLTTSETLCRPFNILSVYSLLLLGVVLVTIPLILMIGAPFAQALRWPTEVPIPGMNPAHMHQAPGFEGLPLLDLLPRFALRFFYNIFCNQQIAGTKKLDEH